jgi:hypothetical protein
MTGGVKADSAAFDEGGGYNCDRDFRQPLRGASGTKHGKSNQWFSFHASSIVIFYSNRTTRNIAQNAIGNTPSQIIFGVTSGTQSDALEARQRRQFLDVFH